MLKLLFWAEDDFYIWIHRLDSKGFLLHKLKVAMASCSLLCLPIFTSLILFYPKNLNALVAFQILGLLYLILILMGKYALYPLKPNVPQAVLIGMTLVLPPLLIFIIPYFFLQSVKRLKAILPWSLSNICTKPLDLKRFWIIYLLSSSQEWSMVL